jgi:hypothetical protein
VIFFTYLHKHIGQNRLAYILILFYILLLHNIVHLERRPVLRSGGKNIIEDLSYYLIELAVRRFASFSRRDKSVETPIRLDSIAHLHYDWHKEKDTI